ncbi:MAG: hypothetical protein JSV17_03530, partial [Candidatus Aminicenantes bacterium]
VSILPEVEEFLVVIYNFIIPAFLVNFRRVLRLISRTMDSGEAFVLTLIDISLLGFIIRNP